MGVYLRWEEGLRRDVKHSPERGKKNGFQWEKEKKKKVAKKD